MKPTEQETSQLVSLMRSWFKMTEHEARDHAEGFLILAYGWGSPPSGAKLEQKIKRDLSKKFDWVSDESRISFEASEKQRFADQEAYISGSASTPRFRA